MLGIVKFSKADEGWGVLAAAELPSDVWAHFAVIEADGFRAFEAGDVVEFDVEEAVQDSFSYRATRATRAVLLRHGPAPPRRCVESAAASSSPPPTPRTLPLHPGAARQQALRTGAPDRMLRPPA